MSALMLLDIYVTDRILQSLYSGVIAVDDQHKIVYANGAAITLCDRGDIHGRPIVEVLGDEALQQALTLKGTEAHFSMVFTSGRGVRREAGFNVVRVDDTDVTWVFVFRDIGDRRHYELELRRVKGLTALGQMAAGFAHEVRNPLAALRSLNECLLNELAADDPRREYSTRMNALVQRIEGLVEHSLRYARPRPPDRKRALPTAVINAALETLAPRLGSATQSQLTVLCPPKMPEVWVDEPQMIQVLVNLVENALDATGDPQHVAVQVVPGEHFVVVNVLDDGPGLTENALQLAFDPFFTTKAKGTGLGLAIAQRLMQDNGGHLHAVSEPFKRTCFSMHMPVAKTAG